MNHNKTILIDGVRYHKDRPASCRQCYFWKNRKVGCTLGKENCYYLAESPNKKNPCEGCCYGPCVSFCMKKVLGSKEVPAMLKDNAKLNRCKLVRSGLQRQDPQGRRATSFFR